MGSAHQTSPISGGLGVAHRVNGQYPGVIRGALARIDPRHGFIAQIGELIRIGLTQSWGQREPMSAHRLE